MTDRGSAGGLGPFHTGLDAVRQWPALMTHPVFTIAHTAL